MSKGKDPDPELYLWLMDPDPDTDNWGLINEYCGVGPQISSFYPFSMHLGHALTRLQDLRQALLHQEQPAEACLHVS